MSFDTYANLQAEVISYLHRSDLDAKVPGFIQLAEAAINRKLNIIPHETTASLTATVGSRFVTRPYGQPIKLALTNTTPYTELVRVLPQALDVATAQATPVYWALDGANLAFEAPCDQAYPLAYRYMADAYLSNANPTSELLTRAPDLYLYGALSQAAVHMQDDERAGFWKSEFASLLRQVHAEYSRTAAVPLRTDVPTSLLNKRY